MLNLTLCYYLNIWKILVKYLILNETLQELNEPLTKITLHGWKEREVNCCFTLTVVNFPPDLYKVLLAWHRGILKV